MLCLSISTVSFANFLQWCLIFFRKLFVNGQDLINELSSVKACPRTFQKLILCYGEIKTNLSCFEWTIEWKSYDHIFFYGSQLLFISS